MLYAQGSPEQRQMAQDAINRWWGPSLMMMGPHDADSPNSAVLARWGIKTKSNDQVRQEFINEHAPEILEAGLGLPDPQMHFDATTQNWIHGPIDWEHFWEVVRGNGPCNHERLEARQKAHDEGAWVREALASYAQRQRSNPVAV